MRKRDQERLIVSGAAPDAVAASLILARRRPQPWRAYADETDASAALSYPAVRKLRRGELVLVAYAPEDDAVARLQGFLGERPEVRLKIYGNHFWTPEARRAVEPFLADGGWRVDPAEWFVTRLASAEDEGDDVDRQLAALVVGDPDGLADPEEAEAWRRCLLSLWRDPVWIPSATEPLLAGPSGGPDLECRVAGGDLDGLLDELAGGAFHRFPVHQGSGALIIHPGRLIAPPREFAARVRKRLDVDVTVSCADGSYEGLLSFGHPPLGRSLVNLPFPDPDVVAADLSFLLPEGTTAAPYDRGSIVLRAAVPLTHVVGSVIEVLPSCESLRFRLI